MKKINFPILILFFYSLLFNGCSKNEPVDFGNVAVDPQNLIFKNSELFDLLRKVTTSEQGNPFQRVVCIDFVYPFKLFVYDSDNVRINDVLLYNDNQFSAFLDNLPNDNSISLSYPLRTTFSDGSEFIVSNNSQLKTVIDSCSKEDIIAYCSGSFASNTECVWKVPYILGEDNEFAGGVFTAYDSGTITLHHLNQSYEGTWVFNFINNELNLNIYLEAIQSIRLKWNFNFKVDSFSLNRIELRTPLFSRSLIKTCIDENEYVVGELGPNNGIIAYDKGIYSNGWRYIEVAQNDLIIEEWGCINSSVTNALFDETGSGFQNTVAIVNHHNELTNYYTNPLICSTQNNGTLSAKSALNLSNNPFLIWSIPSIDELMHLYTNLHIENIGNFNDSNYWSSSESSNSSVKCINFTNGEITILEKNLAGIRTRPIHYF